MPKNGARAAALVSVKEDMNDLLLAGVDTSPLLFSEHGSIRDIDYVLKLNATKEVSDMVLLVD